MFTTTTLTLIVVVVLLVVLALGLFLFLARRLRRRRDELLSELKQSPALNMDRAYNRLHMARREADVVGRSGADTARAKGLIDEAQTAFDQRQYPRAYELAQSAHDSLVALQRAGPRPAAPAALATPLPSAPAGDPGEPAKPLARNRAESHFQIGLLDSELAQVGGARAEAGGTLEARNLRVQAQSAFDREAYTDALRLALKGRRSLGSQLEALPPTGGAAVSGPTLAPAGDPAETAEKVAASERCPSCGYPMLPSDVFCRGCGAPRASLVCPTCGTARSPKDTFCGKCGTRFS